MREHYTNSSIQRAFNLLDRLSADEITRRKVEMREKALKNEVSMLESAREEGRKEGRKVGREEGLRDGILLGISAVLEIKFGANGLALLPEIRQIKSVERLRQLSESIRQTTDLSEIIAIVRNE